MKTKIVDDLKSRLQTILTTGTVPNQSAQESRRVVFFNLMVVVSLIAAIVYLLTFAFLSTPSMAYWLCLIVAILFLLVFYLNANGKIIQARWLHILTSLSAITLGNFLFPKEVNFNILLFFIVGYPWLFFKLSQLKYIIFTLLMTIIAYGVTEIGAYMMQDTPVQVLTSSGTKLLRISFFITIFIFINFILYFIVNEQAKQYHKLKLTLQKSKGLVREKEIANNDLALSLNELEQLAYASSHDLKMPLRGIISFSQLLKRRYKSTLEGTGLEYTEYIEQEGKRQYQQIEGLLDYLKVGRKEKQITTIAPYDLTNEVLLSFRQDMNAKQAQAIVHPLPSITCDPLDFKQIIHNLISNALKFASEKRPPQIEVSGKKNNDWILFTIKDNGIGFDMTYHDQLFEIFKTLSVEDRQKGSGIGLSICKKIVQNYNGKIWATSIQGVGSTFYFTLPATH